MKTFRIFLASPGDVVEERRIAREIIDRIRHERRFRDDLNIQIVAWDQPGQDIALPIGITPQQAISDGLLQPRDCDLVLILLWSRMGTPLPDSYVKSDGSPYLSGTEWEYWNALERYRDEGAPAIWMYRRDEKPKLDIDDPHSQEKHRQWQRLQDFLGMIRNPDGSIAHGLNEYPNPQSFKRRFEHHLRDHLEQCLRSGISAATQQADETPQAVPVASNNKRIESPHIATTRTINAQINTGVVDQGEDEFGLWLRWEHEGVPQVFRWISPGSFMMGSPQLEPQREDDETMHPVTLTKGFWLANTVVTQALWEAVMGSSPLHLKEPEKPIACVSWNDAQELVERLGVLYPICSFRLPTEAEWEYACRAGTLTPFSFGSSICTDQANFDGRKPYSKSVKGKFRKDSVQVKSLPPNPWGLFEMHGNVLEWCSDYYGRLEKVAASDPAGSVNGRERVLRGGSWYDVPSKLRSACRDSARPGYCTFNIGIRLVGRFQLEA